MPPGMPVATVGVNSATNAALLAAQMLAIADGVVREKVDGQRAALRARVVADDESLNER